MATRGTPIETKHPDEEIIWGFFYTPDDLPGSETIVSCTVSAFKISDGSDVSGTFLGSTTGTITTEGTNQNVSVLIQGGDDEEDYVVKFKNTLSDGEIFVDCLKVKVRGCPTD